MKKTESSWFDDLSFPPYTNPYINDDVILRCVETYKTETPTRRLLDSVMLDYNELSILITFTRADIYTALRLLSDLIFDPAKCSPESQIYVNFVEWPLLAALVVKTPNGLLGLEYSDEKHLLALLGHLVLRFGLETNTFYIKFPNNVDGRLKFFQNQSLLFYHERRHYPKDYWLFVELSR